MLPACLLGVLPLLHHQSPANDLYLMRHPTMNATDIVFSYAGDLWTVPRAGGSAERLTSSHAGATRPYFSPDGRTVAFTADLDGRPNVYVIPAKGGQPKRLTADPTGDAVTGWTPDGRAVVFASESKSGNDYPRMFTVPVTGGFPTQLPFPSGVDSSFSPDGSRIAYVPYPKWEPEWKRYRGGQAGRIWIGNMSDSKVVAVPRVNENNEQPMWVGDKVYFLTDKAGRIGIDSYEVSNGHVDSVVSGGDFDVKSASAGPGGIVYERLGSLEVYDFSSKRSNRVPVTISADFPETRPTYKALHNLSSAVPSPSGTRILCSGRGWVFTLPEKKGDMHLLGEAQGVHRDSAIWAPDGKTIAFVTNADRSHQQIALWDVATGKERHADLGEAPSDYTLIRFSPDSSKILYTDYRLRLWLFDVASGKNTEVMRSQFADPRATPDGDFSPDSKWIAFSQDLPNHLHAIKFYEIATGKSVQVTDGMADAKHPIFDRSGKYLYFMASTNVGAASSWLDMSNYTIPNVTSSIYCAVLHKEDGSPLFPESDEEALAPSAPPVKPGGPAGKPAAPAPAPPIDLEGIEQRIIALPMPSTTYSDLVAGPAGSFFALTTGTRATALSPELPSTLLKFSLDDRKPVPFAQGVAQMNVTPRGDKALLVTMGGVELVSTMAPMPPGAGAVDLSRAEVLVDPKAEWEHMYHEVWQQERVHFWSPILSGIDSVAMEQKYEPFLANVSTRADLNYLFEDLTGELSVGHMWCSGGDMPGEESVPAGLLGADYSFENHRYRLTRVYDGERWNPGLYAPLAQPGGLAKAGEYILAVDGKDLTEATDIYVALDNKAGKQVKVTIGPNPDGSGSRTVTVVPVASEGALRQRAWTEDNRRAVDKLTGGRAGYVHVPDTNLQGWREFQRFYFAQVGKDGMVVDERFNHGGLINDYMIQEMKTTLDGAFAPRFNGDWPTPGSAIYGPKVMLANEMSGSGGDMFPWLFKHNHVGTLVGKRTWGGLIAAASFGTVDGGRVNAPDYAFYDPKAGKWDVENWGVSPDVDVDLDPYLWRQGRDSQLERAVAELNKALANYKPQKFQRPPYPDKTKLNIRP